MSNDYTAFNLPAPAFRLKWYKGAYYVDCPRIGDTDCYTADQLHACTEAARAPLLARIAELEAENKRLEAALDAARHLWGSGVSEVDRLESVIDRYRSEVEEYKADSERHVHLKSIAKVGITKRQEFVITLNLVPCPNHIGELDVALDADRNYNNKEPTPE